MINQSTIDKLIEMRLTTMADAFRNQLNDPKFKEVPFEDRFGMLVDIECSNRKNNRQKRLIRNAVVEIPPSMLDGGYPVNAVQAVLPLEDAKASPYSWRLSVSYEVKEEALPAFTKVIADYSENVNTDMGYMTKASLMEEFSTMVNAIRIIGIALGAVIALIGILNFINSVVTGILARKRELAILCSIGMTQSQLKKMLLEEGLYYVLISGLISLILGTGLSYLVMTALNNVILFFVYRPNFLAFLIMLPLLAVLAAVVPTVAYRRMQKESIVQRLRDTES